MLTSPLAVAQMQLDPALLVRSAHGLAAGQQCATTTDRARADGVGGGGTWGGEGALGVLGVDATAWNGLPLLLDLSAMGMTNCDLQIRVDATTVLGGGGWSLAVPNLPALVGSRAWCQAQVLAPGANLLGALASNGVELRIGRR